MSAEWKKLKTEINKSVDQLKIKLGPDFNADSKKTTVVVLAKFKDNAKEALITVSSKSNPDVKSELAIDLQNTKNLSTRFDSLLSDFKSKNK